MNEWFKSRKTVALSEAIDRAAVTSTVGTMRKNIQPLGSLLNTSTFTRNSGSIANNALYLAEKVAEASSWETLGESLSWNEIYAYILEVASSLGIESDSLSSNLLNGLVEDIFNDARQRHLDGDAPELADYTAQILVRLRRNESYNAQLTPPAMSRPQGSPGSQGSGGGAPPPPPPVPDGTPQQVAKSRASQAQKYLDIAEKLDAQGPAQGAAADAWRQRAAQALDKGIEAQNQAVDRWKKAQAEADVARGAMDAAKARHKEAFKAYKERRKKWEENGRPSEEEAEIIEENIKLNQGEEELEKKEKEFKEKQEEANEKAAEAKAAADALKVARERLNKMASPANQMLKTTLIPTPFDKFDDGNWEESPNPWQPQEQMPNPFAGCVKIVPCPCQGEHGPSPEHLGLLGQPITGGGVPGGDNEGKRPPLKASPVDEDDKGEEDGDGNQPASPNSKPPANSDGRKPANPPASDGGGGGKSVPTRPITDPTKTQDAAHENRDSLPPDSASRRAGKKSEKLDYQRRLNLKYMASEFGSGYAIPPDADLSNDKEFVLHQRRLQAEYLAKQVGLKNYSVPKNLILSDLKVYRKLLQHIMDMGRNRLSIESRQRKIAELRSMTDPIDRLKKAFDEAFELGKLTEEVVAQLRSLFTREALAVMAVWVAGMGLFSALTGGTGAALTLGTLIAILGPGIMPLVIGMYNVTTAEIPEEFELGVEQIVKGLVSLGLAGILSFFSWLFGRKGKSGGESPKPTKTPAGGKSPASGKARAATAPKSAASSNGSTKSPVAPPKNLNGASKLPQPVKTPAGGKKSPPKLKNGVTHNGNGASKPGLTLEDFKGAKVTPGPNEAAGGVNSRLPGSSTKPGASRLPPIEKPYRIKVLEPVEVGAGGKNPAAGIGRSHQTTSPHASGQGSGGPSPNPGYGSTSSSGGKKSGASSSGSPGSKGTGNSSGGSTNKQTNGSAKNASGKGGQAKSIPLSKAKRIQNALDKITGQFQKTTNPQKTIINNNDIVKDHPDFQLSTDPSKTRGMLHGLEDGQAWSYARPLGSMSQLKKLENDQVFSFSSFVGKLREKINLLKSRNNKKRSSYTSRKNRKKMLNPDNIVKTEGHAEFQVLALLEKLKSELTPKGVTITKAWFDINNTYICNSCWEAINLLNDSGLKLFVRFKDKSGRIRTYKFDGFIPPKEWSNGKWVDVTEWPGRNP